MKHYVFLLVSGFTFAYPGMESLANPTDGQLWSVQVGFGGLAADSTTESDLTTYYRPRRRGLIEPAAFVMAVHAVGMGILVSMDPAETGFKPMHVDNWVDGMRKPPIWDNDSWITNYILHPLWGSETYLRARAQNYTPVESFLFSTAASVAWEYAFESWAEHPSKQDLLVTSTVGSILGEIRYITRRALTNRDEAWATVLLILVDPFGMMMKHAAILARDVHGSIASLFKPDVTITPSFADASGANAPFGLRLSVSL